MPPAQRPTALLARLLAADIIGAPPSESRETVTPAAFPGRVEVTLSRVIPARF
jgi:hypothetical protein